MDKQLSLHPLTMYSKPLFYPDSDDSWMIYSNHKLTPNKEMVTTIKIKDQSTREPGV